MLSKMVLVLETRTFEACILVIVVALLSSALIYPGQAAFLSMSTPEMEISSPVGLEDTRAPIERGLNITKYDWPMYQHDLNNSGYSPSSAPDYPNVTWTFEAGYEVLSTPAVAYGMVYLTVDNRAPHEIIALDEDSGGVVWTAQASHYIDYTPAVADGRVIAGTADGRVYAWNAFNGSLLWLFNHTYGPHRHMHIHSSPAIDEVNGRVFIRATVHDTASDEKFSEFLCLDPTNGQMIWNYTMLDSSSSKASPVVSENAVFTAMAKRMLSFDGSDGTILWEQSLGSGHAPTLGNHTLYFDGSQSLFALDELNGSLKWQVDDGYGSGRSSTAYHDGLVFLGRPTNNVTAFDSGTGDIVWNYRGGGKSRTPPVIADGKVFVALRDGYLYALDEKTGSLIWKFHGGKLFKGGPAVANGKLFIGNVNGTLFALGESTPGHVEATIDCDPDTLNLRSRGKWITCYVELPAGFSPKDIDPRTVLLNDILLPDLTPKYGFVKSEGSYIVDHNNDGTEERMFKFNRSEVGDMLPSGIDVVLTISGELLDGTVFEGSDTINVFNAPKWSPLNRSETSWMFRSRYL